MGKTLVFFDRHDFFKPTNTAFNQLKKNEFVKK